jgi:hypothetical protein
MMQLIRINFISETLRSGGLHPSAHLWDTGTDAVSELDRVMKVRAKALSKFGKNSIKRRSNGNA